MNEAIPATRSIVVERALAYPPGKVWRALTQDWLIADWLMQNDFVPEPGHRFTFRTAPMPHWNGVVEGEVLAVEPERLLTYRWDVPGEGGGLRTVVTWTLIAQGPGVLLRMEQAGFAVGQEANFRGAEFGWQRFITALERVLEEKA